MRKWKQKGLLAIILSVALSCISQIPATAASSAVAKIPGSSNPLMDHKLGADPYALVYDGRVYVYMTGDKYIYNNDGTIADNKYSTIGTINVISSADMTNWTDHGSIPVAGANNSNNGNGIAKWASQSWAPAAAYKKINGKDKFFLYFANNASGIGVLTADSPIGPWSDPLGKALVTHNAAGMSDVTWLFDPAVLVDDDGSGYLYLGGGIPDQTDATSIANPKTARVLKLGTDMISIAGTPAVIDAPYMFEDSGIHKYNGKYYYSYCINFAGTHPSAYPKGEIGYMVSDSPMGPFQYQGHFLKNPGTFFGVGGNNHHAVFHFMNEWYVVYHAQTVSKAQLGEGKGYRSTHINKLTHNTDGSIQEVVGNMTGVPQIANLNPYTRVEAETIGWQAGISTKAGGSVRGPFNNQVVTDIHNGDWVALGNVDFGSAGANTFYATIASTLGGKIEVRLDSVTGPLVGTLTVPSTGGTQNWTEVQTTISGANGVHNVFFVFSGGMGNLFDWDSWRFNPASTNTTNGTTYEAEVNTTLVNAIVESTSSASGTIQFVNFNAMSGASIQWNTINCAYTGTKNVKFRYALQSGTRYLDVIVNGTKVIDNAAFPATGSWSTWGETTIQVPMTSGVNTLKVVTTGTEGPNVDYIQVSPAH